MNKANARTFNRIMERAAQTLFLLAACVSILAVLLICFFLFANSIPAIKEIGLLNFIGGKRWKPGSDLYGIFPMILGSIYTTAGAILVGVPVGIFTAVFMAFYCPKGLYKVMKPAAMLLAGIPSVVYGFFGMMILIPFVQNTFGGSGSSLFTASLLLGIMILPTIINVSESSLRAVPPNFYEGSLALGATHERSIFFVVLPAAKSGIMAGVILGVGRAIGETMAIIMVAGNQAVIPTNIFTGVRTMTANIVIEMGYASGLHRNALTATALVLFVFILIINITFSLVKKRSEKI